MAIDPVTAGIVTLKAGYDYWSNKRASDKASEIQDANVSYAKKRLESAKKVTKYEKSALATLRRQMDDPTKGREVLRDTSKVLADRSNVQAQDYLGRSQDFMGDSLVAKKISQEIDIESNKKLVDLAEKIAIKNQQAREQLSGKYADTQLKIGEARSNRIQSAEDMLHSAEQGRDISALKSAQAERDSLANFLFAGTDLAISSYAQNEINDASEIFLNPQSTDEEKKQALFTLSRWDEQFDLNTALDSLFD